MITEIGNGVYQVTIDPAKFPKDVTFYIDVDNNGDYGFPDQTDQCIDVVLETEEYNMVAAQLAAKTPSVPLLPAAPARTLTIRSSDSGRVLTQTLVWPGGQPINLAGGSVRFSVQRANGTELFGGAAAIPLASAGQVSYTLQAGDVASAAGVYGLIWQVTLPGGIVVAFPSSGTLPVVLSA